MLVSGNFFSESTMKSQKQCWKVKYFFPVETVLETTLTSPYKFFRTTSQVFLGFRCARYNIYNL